MRRALRMLAVCVLAGGVVSILVALAAAVFVDFAPAKNQTLRAYDGRVEWSVDVQRTRWAERYQSLRVAGLPWAEDQAAGAADTPRQGDERSAWASAGTDNQPEWLELDYAEAIQPVAIHIYESFNPGAVTKVTLFDTTGNEQVAWEGKDPTTKGTNVAIAKLPLTTILTTRRAKIHIDSPSVTGWNEIDAVGLVEANGTIHWARRARASSVYASGRQPVTPSISPQIPGWTGLTEPLPPFANDQVKREWRIVDGFGWPMIAMRADRADTTSVMLPTKPVWSGIAVNAMLLGMLLAIARWLLTRPIYRFKEGARARRGYCVRCGYDLQFDLKNGCPECGWRRA